MENVQNYRRQGQGCGLEVAGAGESEAAVQAKME